MVLLKTNCVINNLVIHIFEHTKDLTWLLAQVEYCQKHLANVCVYLVATVPHIHYLVHKGWGETTCTLVPWRQGFRQPTKKACMGWFAQIVHNDMTEIYLSRVCCRMGPRWQWSSSRRNQAKEATSFWTRSHWSPECNIEILWNCVAAASKATNACLFTSFSKTEAYTRPCSVRVLSQISLNLSSQLKAAISQQVDLMWQLMNELPVGAKYHMLIWCI